MAWLQEVRPPERRPAADDDRQRRVATRVGAGALLVLGLALFRGFGVPWDEDLKHQYGELLLRYLAHGDRAWETFVFEKLYGPVVAVPQAIIDRLAPAANTGYQYGHLLVFLIFASSVFAFYGLCTRQFKSWRWGLLGAAMLVLTPRIFTHAFVNDRDVPFMAFIVIAFYLVVRFAEERTTRWIVAAGAASALAIDVRVGGLFVVGLALMLLVGDAMTDQDRRTALRKLVRPLAIYAVVTAVLTYALWPFLWPNPIGRFIDVLRFFEDFKVATPFVLYRGQVLSVLHLPWHFIPWWIVISTPIPYLLLAAAGAATMPLRRLRTVFRERSVDRYLSIYGAWFVLPIALVIVGRSVVYDDWRHLMFVYPPMVVFAVAGAKKIYDRLSSRPGWNRICVAGLTVMLAWVAGTMIRFHPYENVYFNALVGGTRGAEGRYELDYGGLSYKQGLEYLLKSRPGPIKVTACTRPGYYSTLLFGEADWVRILYVPPAQADYAVCVPIWGLGMTVQTYFPDRPTIYSVSRGGGTILFIKRLR